MKTKPTGASVSGFIENVEHETRRRDAHALNEMMSRITGEEPEMWGASIVGYGRYRYTNSKGKALGWFLTGFSPRKQALTVYIMPGFLEESALMARLGKHKTGRSCLYINKLDDVDVEVLEQLIARSVAWMREKYGD